MATGVNQAVVKLGAQIVVSFAILASSLYIILSGAYDDTYSKWAFGMAGLVAGYWLR